MESFPRGNRPGGKERGERSTGGEGGGGRGEKEQVGESPALQLWHIKHTKRGPGGAGIQHTPLKTSVIQSHRERERESERDPSIHREEEDIIHKHTNSGYSFDVFGSRFIVSMFFCFLLFLNVFVGDRMVW